MNQNEFVVIQSRVGAAAAQSSVLTSRDVFKKLKFGRAAAQLGKINIELEQVVVCVSAREAGAGLEVDP